MKASVKAWIETLTGERERIDTAIQALRAMGGGETPAPLRVKKRKPISAEGRRRMSEAAKRRVANQNGNVLAETPAADVH